MRVLLRLVTLLIAVTSAGLPAAEAGTVCPAASGREASIGAASVSASPFAAPRALWTVADVDGDRIDDLVRVATDAADATEAAGPAGSRQAVSPEIVGAGCRIEAATIGIARVLDGTLAARDLDADHDLDLVHLDAAGRPLRAWLNDGHGAFQAAPGDLARGRIPSSRYRQAPASTFARVDVWHASHGVSLGFAPACSRVERPRPASAPLAASIPLVASVAWHSAVTRGPPVLA
jgi:hypothetical protein